MNPKLRPLRGVNRSAQQTEPAPGSRNPVTQRPSCQLRLILPRTGSWARSLGSWAAAGHCRCQDGGRWAVLGRAAWSQPGGPLAAPWAPTWRAPSPGCSLERMLLVALSAAGSQGGFPDGQRAGWVGWGGCGLLSATLAAWIWGGGQTSPRPTGATGQPEPEGKDLSPQSSTDFPQPVQAASCEPRASLCPWSASSGDSA